MARERSSPARMPTDVLHRRPVPCPSNGSVTLPSQEFCCSRAAATPTLHATQNPDFCPKHCPRSGGAPKRVRACPCGDKVCRTIAFCVFAIAGVHASRGCNACDARDAGEAFPSLGTRASLHFRQNARCNSCRSRSRGRAWTSLRSGAFMYSLRFWPTLKSEAPYLRRAVRLAGRLVACTLRSTPKQ
jgi:hypothetical protein